jgi:hypothetical protein
MAHPKGSPRRSPHVPRSGVPALGVAAACGTLFVLLAAPAVAQEPAKKKALSSQCASASRAVKQASEAQKQGRLRDALGSYRECQAAGCGGLSQACLNKATQLAARMPSVIPLVSDEEGAPQANVEVKLDGVPLCSHLDGRGIPVDPGMHEFTFSVGSSATTQMVMVADGQQNRPLSVNLHSNAAAKSNEAGASKTTSDGATAERKPAGVDKSDTVPDKDKVEPRPVGPGPDATDVALNEEPRRRRLGPLPFAWVAGGVAVTGLLAGGLLTYWGSQDNAELERTCSPNCKPASVTHVKALYLASDISFGVGAVAAAVAVGLFVAPRYGTEAEKPAPKTSYVFDLRPLPSGALAAVTGRF